MNTKQNLNENSTRRPGWRSCWLTGGIFIVIFPIVALILLKVAGAILIVEDPIQPSDAAVVLSGGDNTRIDEAVNLYELKYMKYIILTETEVPLPEKGAEYSTRMRYVTMQKGVPGNNVIITKQQSENTYEEAEAVLKLMKQRGWDSVIVITDPYHTLRAHLIFEEVFKDSGVQFAVHPVQNHWYTSSTWWLHKEGWQRTMQEYIRLFAFWAGQR